MPEQHDIFRAILNSAQENIVLLDKEFRIICYNTTIQQTLYHYFGKNIAEGDDYRNFVVPASMELFLETFKKAESGETVVVEHETIGPDFSIWFQYKMNPVTGSDGISLGILLSAKDISVQKKSEISLKQNEEKFRKIFESAVNPIVIINNNCRVVMVNPGVEKVFLYQSAELIDESIEMLVPGFITGCFREYEDNLKTGNSSEYGKAKGNFIAVRKDGVNILVEMGFNTLEVDNEQYLLVMIQDVTEQIDREKQLKKANHQLILLNKINDIVHKEQDQEEMLRQVTKCIIDDGGYKLVWIGKQPDIDDSCQQLIPLYAYGETAYLNEIHIFMNQKTQENGPSVTCLKLQKPVITNNVHTSDNFAPWLKAASKYGIRSSLVLPVNFRGVAACMNIYAKDFDAFDDEEVYILSQIANIISRTIANIQLSEERNEALFQLNERVKEMRTVHKVESLLKEETRSIDEILSALTSILPDGWQFPDNCNVHIRFSAENYYSRHYQDTTNKIVESFQTLDGKSGFIEIGYTSTNDNSDLPFLAEEKQLLRTITEMLVVYYNKYFISGELKKTQANLLTVFNNTDVGYLLLNKEMVVLEYNTAFFKEYLRITGVQVEKGADWKSLVIQAKRTFAEELIKKLQSEKISVTYDTHYTVNGQDEYFTITLAPIIENGEIIGYILATINITEKKLNEIERHKLLGDLIQRNSNLEQFAYIVSHNLRAPVANIIGLSDLLKEKKHQAESFSIIISGLSESARKLDAVIIDLDQTLRIRREGTEKQELIHFSAIMNEVVKGMEQTINEVNVQVETNFTAAPAILSVKTYMLNIFNNIIKNSIKFAQEGIEPKIAIWTEKTGNMIKVNFKDNGSGIDTIRYKDQLFGLYKRFSQHTKGRGVGLFMVKHQVETLQGTIELNSMPGEGTHIIITFTDN